jgi:hypothetical protein
MMMLYGNVKLAESIEIDYSQANTVEKTYLDFFKRYQEKYNTLRLLMDSGLCQGSVMRPTWVPDWRCELRANLDLTMESAASHFLVAECHYRDDHRLVIKATPAITVSDVRYLSSSSSWEWNVQWYQELAALLGDILSPDDVDGGIESFTRAFVTSLANPGWSVEVIQCALSPFKKYLKLLYEAALHEESVHGPQDHMDGETAARFESCVRWFKITRCPFVVSANGYVGVGPIGSQIRDEVFAVLGCRSLMLLRPSSDRRSYQVVGPCFVHGFNWGEALLGPLPDGFTVIPRFQPSRSGHLSHYVNLKTETESMWDPRIEWQELEAHPPMVNFVPIQAPPGEPFRIRPDSEYLKRHGIELQTLMLE